MAYRRCPISYWWDTILYSLCSLLKMQKWVWEGSFHKAVWTYLSLITAYGALIAVSTQTFPPVITKRWHRAHEERVAIFFSYCAEEDVFRRNSETVNSCSQQKLITALILSLKSSVDELNHLTVWLGLNCTHDACDSSAWSSFLFVNCNHMLPKSWKMIFGFSFSFT